MITPLALCALGGLWGFGLFALERRAALSIRALSILILLGLVARLLAFSFEPYLEIDFFRYFWDGRQLSHGFNPYAQALPSPLLSSSDLYAFAQKPENLSIWQHVHADTHALSTIYAPLSVSVFAALDLLPGPQEWAYVFSFLGAEAATLFLIFSHMPRSRWGFAVFAMALNPLVILVTYNGLHFDIWLLPLLMGWALMVGQQRALPALMFLMAAIALRHWPAVLLPLTLMLMANWRARWIGGGICALGLIAAFWPQLMFFDAYHSGLRVYGEQWAMNSALFTVLETSMGSGLARFLALGIACILALALPFTRLRSAPVLIATIVVGTLLLLSPTFFPWYWLWLLPFLLILNHWVRWPLLALTATLPLYYLRFALEATGHENLFDNWIVWIEFGPILLSLVLGALAHGRCPDHPRPQ